MSAKPKILQIPIPGSSGETPTGAIQFGSLRHEQTPMVQMRREPRSYAVLHDQGTRPRTVYLARITNPNPAVDDHPGGEHGE